VVYVHLITVLTEFIQLINLAFTPESVGACPNEGSALESSQPTILPVRIYLSDVRGRGTVLRARKRSSERMAMALRKRMLAGREIC
jgi:hypothetical protein